MRTITLAGSHARSAQREVALPAGSTLKLDFDDGERARVVIEGAGELVLVKFAAFVPS